MSADNWEVCPRCLAQARAHAARELDAVMQRYGQIPVAEFDERRAKVPTVDPEDYRSLREDYEFYGADEGEVCASYSCQCTACGLGTSFLHKKRFWEPKP